MDKIHRLFSSLFVVISLTSLPVICHAEIVSLVGEDGEYGVDGTNGLPGFDGNDGQTVIAAAAGVISPELNRASAIAGDGGNGGKGSSGLFEHPDGADGGDGGNGGSAFAAARGVTSGVTPNVNVNARGGDGGDGGRGGSAYLNGTRGGSGDGGHGGNVRGLLEMSAFDIPNGDLLDIDLRAFGGWGGQAYFGDAVAGDGGDAYGAANVALVSASYITRLGLDIRGGAGGAGIEGSHGGDGGQAVVGPVVISAGNQGTFEARISVVGGSGGDAPGSISHDSGDGGSGVAVSLRNQVVFSGRNIDLVQSATGGDGGGADEGVLGQAGFALSELIHDDSEIAGNLSLLTGATGGDGGDRRHSENAAGAGADGEARTHLNSSRQYAEAGAASTGGSGGTGMGGANGGAAGNALAESELFFSSSTPSSSGSSRATAWGGDAGSALYGINRVGANGGNAVANANVTGINSNHVTATATARAGGAGSISADSGTGGNGGVSQATAVAHGDGSVTTYADAYGSSGGTSVGIGFRGGDGSVGTATATAVSSGDGDVLSWVTSTGGGGGKGEEGADGGDGADVNLENAASGITNGALIIRQTAQAGSASAIFGSGSTGVAGNATTRSNVTHRGSEIVVIDTARAGGGGANYDDGATSNGGQANASAHILSFGDAFVELNVHGGDGGNASSSLQAAGSGGDAVLGEVIIRADGDAQIDVLLEPGRNGRSPSDDDGSTGSIVIDGPVFAESTNSGLVDVLVHARIFGAQQGGFTQDVVLKDIANGATFGELRLEQIATAGNLTRYNEARTNHAADAVAELTRIGHLESLTVKNQAYGGNGPASSTFFAGQTGIAGNGGNANANSIAQNSGGEAHSTARAGGGVGGDGSISGGAGGIGNARAVAHSLASGFATSANSGAYSGRAGESDGGLDATGTDGTDVTSFASATSSGTGNANAISSGAGGAGSSGSFPNLLGVGGNGGASLSTANAVTDGGTATARAIATGGRGGEDAVQTGRNGTAQSLATAVSNFTATAIAESESGSLFNAPTDAGRNISTASAMAHMATASAQSVSRAFSLVREIWSSADVTTEAHALARTISASGMLEADDLSNDFMGTTATAISVPDNESVTELLSSSTNIADDFDVGGDSDVLAFVNMGVGFNDQTATNPVTMSSGVHLEVNMDFLDNSQNLLFGLLDFHADVGGLVDFNFRIDVEHTTIINMAFSSVLEVESFFTDNTLDLGVISELLNPDGVLDIDVSIFSDTPLADTGFVFRGLLGNSTIDIAAVPLPAGLWLFMSACGALFWRHRSVQQQ